MSLVVARKIGNEIYIVSDTKLTDLLRHEKIPPDQGTIKSIILKPDLTICFAGNVPLAAEAIRSADLSLDLAEIRSHFLNAHKASLPEVTGGEIAPVEFILATAVPNP